MSQCNVLEGTQGYIETHRFIHLQCILSAIKGFQILCLILLQYNYVLSEKLDTHIQQGQKKHCLYIETDH